MHPITLIENVLKNRINMKWSHQPDGLHYSCEINDGYMYYGYTDGNWLYTEIRCIQGKHPRKILTYYNDYTHIPVISTQESIFDVIMTQESMI